MPPASRDQANVGQSPADKPECRWSPPSGGAWLRMNLPLACRAVPHTIGPAQSGHHQYPPDTMLGVSKSTSQMIRPAASVFFMFDSGPRS